MKFETITIKDIAKALGLSISTVSRALRDSYEISAETKRIVTEYAQKMNYKPNQIALSLKERSSKAIGIVVSEIANNFFSQAINGIESIAYDKGYNVIITQTYGSYERELINVAHLASRSVDGLLVSLSSETTNVDHYQGLHDKNMPIVFFDCIANEIKTHKVISDNEQGAYDAVTHFIKNGYKKIAFLGNAPHLSTMQNRHAGYLKAHLENKIVPNPDYVKYCAHGGMVLNEVENSLQELFSMKVKPDAILTCGDNLTTRTLRYLKANNIKMPDDVALVGFSNRDLSELLNPSLSVVHQPAFDIGQNAINLLLQLIASKTKLEKFNYNVLPCQLFERESSFKKKKK
ncbi:LacI family transcriptional regulator [Sphingobacteriaceae bacterium]|nr:LacI family transcriptional regulator [Sphingobacteriaceae bacterium]